MTKVKEILKDHPNLQTVTRRSHTVIVNSNKEYTFTHLGVAKAVEQYLKQFIIW